MDDLEYIKKFSKITIKTLRKWQEHQRERI